jgi:K+-transporting ATPase KdpF subunit
MDINLILAGLVVVGLLIYLFLSLIKPEWFG